MRDANNRDRLLLSQEYERLRQVLQPEYERLKDQQRRLEEEIRIKEKELEELVRRLNHMQALIDYETADAPRVTYAPIAKVEAAERGRDKKSDAADIAYAILEERGGEPMYYKELADAVLARGAELIGVDPAQILVSRLVRDDRFVRPLRRGWYALRVHYPKSKSVGLRTKSAARKRGASQSRTHETDLSEIKGK